MLCVDVIYVLKIICCTVVVFMMQKLTLMGLLIQPNTNPLEISKKVSLDGANMKDIYSKEVYYGSYVGYW